VGEEVKAIRRDPVGSEPVVPVGLGTDGCKE